MDKKVDYSMKVTLVLTEEEAKWLKGYIQNPHYDYETRQDTAMRAAFFEALTHNFE